MIDRRNVIIGLACLSGAAGAALLRPRERIDLLGERTLEDIVPTRSGNWVLEPGIGALLPPSEGSLADRLYDEMLSRGYRNVAVPEAGPVMLLATHGRLQSDALQLHRPEACYPALGFVVTERRLERLVLAPSIVAPSVLLTARLDQRIEDILYWTRLGPYFPQTAGAQRSDRMRLALEGKIADGVLFRISAVRRERDQPQFDALKDYARALAATVAPANRAALFASA